MARLEQLVVDCDHPASLARFWAAALDAFARDTWMPDRDRHSFGLTDSTASKLCA